jgi:hypothetical protein
VSLRRIISLLVVTVAAALAVGATSAAPAVVLTYGKDGQSCRGILLGGDYVGRGTQVQNGKFTISHCSARLVEGEPVEETHHFVEATPTGGCTGVITPGGRMNYTCKDTR